MARKSVRWGDGRLVKIGDAITIKKMMGEPRYDGRRGTVTFIDDEGQLHGTWGGLGVVAGDEFEVEVDGGDDEGHCETKKEEKTMKALDLGRLVNGLVADELNQKLEFVPMMDAVPENGAMVLLHGWEEDEDSEEDGYDCWELATWYEEGTAADVGVVWANDDLQVVQQTIKESGFYAQDAAGEWYRVSDENYDCWCELKRSGAGKLRGEVKKLASVLERKVEKEAKKAEGAKAAQEAQAKIAKEAMEAKKVNSKAGKAESEEEGEEVLFTHSFRLGDGSIFTVETIPSEKWGNGEELPDDEGAFNWQCVDRRGWLNDGGELRAKFSMPEEGKDWDTVEIADQILRYVMKTKMGINNPTGWYALID